MLLYHEQKRKRNKYIKKGFDFELVNHVRNTYGKGIYLHQIMRRKFYAENDGIVISLNIEIKPFFLTKDISPSSKKIKIDKEKYNCIVNPNKDEYLIYFIDKI